MGIGVGDRIPSVPVKRVTADATEDVDSAEYLGAGRIVMFTLPGAFTPTCHRNHLPGYVALADEIKAKGVDKIVCAAANDRHVMKVWGEQSAAFPALEMLSDAHAELAKALGLDKDFPDLGIRFVRSSWLINHGVVQSITLESGSTPELQSGAAAMLEALRAESGVGAQSEKVQSR
jgi:peroxiredoxin